MTHASAPSTLIDRRALVARHAIELTEPHPEHVLSVGNGDFAFTADVTGMQTFTDFHSPSLAIRRGEVAVNTCTMSSWGWHETPNPHGWTLDDAMSRYETARGTVLYPDKHDMEAAMRGQTTDENRAGAWLNANPHRVDLARIGLELRSTPEDEPETDPAVLSGVQQRQDLWTGVISSEFHYEGHKVTVTTVADPEDASVAFRVESPLLADGRARVALRFPYPSDGFFQTDDWNSADAHTSALRSSRAGEAIDRTIDAQRYTVEVITTSGVVSAAPTPHTFYVDSLGDHLELVVRFHPEDGGAAESVTFNEVRERSENAWERFWLSGAAVSFEGSTDPRATELERRVILSQYLTRVHCAGLTPPAETGLVTNSWQGKFHLEMHWWHAAHFASWGRPELLERSLDWYLSILGQARATAERQGNPGARWPKQTSIDGRESPDPIGSLLAWQQPHVLYMLELAWTAASPQHQADLLLRFGELVEDTASFMAAFPESDGDVLHLGPPIMPAQEFYNPRETVDPTYELAYWWWGLEIAQRWRERTAKGRSQSLADVQDRLARPRVLDGRYLPVASSDTVRRDDHPSLLMALGFVPPTPMIDTQIMTATLHDVWNDWEWPTAWGWDFSVISMTAARLGLGALAFDALTSDELKNHLTAVGHNPQMGSILPLYLPGNGSLLAAVALIAQLGVGAPGWQLRAEGFPPLSD